MGEALGLRWRAVTCGDDDEDRRRALLIDTNRPRGGEAEAPKSGRARKVQLSRRLRGALFALYRQCERPLGDAFVLRRAVGTFRNVVWPRILQAADIGHRRPTDLRDTFASQLLSCGVQLGYVSTQLGSKGGMITGGPLGGSLIPPRARAAR
jgi:integrase